MRSHRNRETYKNFHSIAVLKTISWIPFRYQLRRLELGVLASKAGPQALVTRTPVIPNVAQASHTMTSSPTPASLSHRRNPEPEPDTAITPPPASVTEGPAKTLTVGTGSVTSADP